MTRPVALLLHPLLAAVGGAAVAAALSLGLVAWIDATPDPEPWADLGRFLVGLALAALAGLVVWVALLARAARRLFPAGRRRRPVLLSVGLVAGTWVLLGVASAVLTELDVMGTALGRTGTAVAVLVVAVGPGLVFRRADRRRGPTSGP